MEIQNKVKLIRSKIDKVMKDLQDYDDNTELRRKVENLLIILKALNSKLIVDNSILDAHISRAAFKINDMSLKHQSTQLMRTID